MIHVPIAEVIQLHRRLGDARLLRFLTGYSVGQAAEALQAALEEHRPGAGAAATGLAADLAQRQVRLITLLDMEYPARLRALEDDAPPFLYFTGDVTRLKARSIAIIGTRKPTAMGQQAARAAAHGAVQADWTVVSGNAPGIDCAAHEAAVQGENGQTVVFPPAPLDQYRQIFATVAPDRVTVASPFAPGTVIQPWMFLRRNTLVAAHCSAAFIGETGIRGGTLDTLKKLQQMRKPVFVTWLPEGSRYARAHHLLAAGGIRQLDFSGEAAEAVQQLTSAASEYHLHPAVTTAVLQDFFSEETYG